MVWGWFFFSNHKWWKGKITCNILCDCQEKPKDGQSSDSGALVSAPPYVKHPLQNKWALWFYKNDKTKSWKANLRLVTSFDTVSFTDQ